MSINRFFSAFLIFLFPFFLSVCDITVSSGGSGGYKNYKYFDFTLQEIWTSEYGSLYQGAIEITNNTIKITGYFESQTPVFGNDNQRPFKGIPRGIFLSGYSENGRIFVENYFPDGLPYRISNVGVYYPYTKELRFNFGGRDEALYIKEY